VGRPSAGPPSLPIGIAARPAAGLRLRRRVMPLLQHGLRLVLAVPFVLPFYWMATSALKNPVEILSRPIMLWPSPMRWENVAEALTFEGFPFFLFLRNSLLYAGLVMIGTVVSCSAIGYGFARLRFPGRNLLFMITVSTMMLPSFVTFIPT
jgi:multiple sugar transport system permease protein